jgi:hypothetical protein
VGETSIEDGFFGHALPLWRKKLTLNGSDRAGTSIGGGFFDETLPL